MLEMQMRVLAAWYQAAGVVRERVEVARRDDRGEVTSTTAIIVILVVAAIAAGGFIAQRITSNANSIPSP